MNYKAMLKFLFSRIKSLLCLPKIGLSSYFRESKEMEWGVRAFQLALVIMLDQCLHYSTRRVFIVMKFSFMLIECFVIWIYQKSKSFVHESLKFSNYHYNIIRCFGQFLQRNVAFDEESAEKEINYLKEIQLF